MNFKKLLEMNSITQSELSRKLNISRGLVTHWVVGRVKPTQIKHFIVMSEILNIKLEELVKIFYKEVM